MLSNDSRSTDFKTAFLPADVSGVNGPVIFWDACGFHAAHTGIGSYARNLRRELVKLGASPILVGEAPTLATMPESESIEVQPSKLSRSGLVHAMASWAAVKQWAIEHPDRTVILHGQANLNLPMWTWGRPPNLRLVLTVHDLIPLIEYKVRYWKSYVQFRFGLGRVLQSADRIVCISNWTRDELQRRFPSTSKKNCVISNGRPVVPADSNRVCLRADPQDPAEATISLITVSRFEVYKRIEFLADLLTFDPRLRLLVVTTDVGQTVLRQQYSDLVEQGRLQVVCGLDDDELLRLLAAADVYVQASRVEGFCLPAVEALSCGTPVVYQSGSGIDEVCGTKVSVPMNLSDGPEQWVSAINDLFMRSRGDLFPVEMKRHLESLSTWSDTASSLHRLYHELGCEMSGEAAGTVTRRKAS